MIPALHMMMSSLADCSRYSLADFRTDSREVRSHSRNVILMPGAVSLIFEISSCALLAFRPLKKMCDGFLAAMEEMNPAPRPVVPEISVSYGCVMD